MILFICLQCKINFIKEALEGIFKQAKLGLLTRLFLGALA